MKRLTSAKLLVLGGILVSAGVAIGGAYWIFTLEQERGLSFWEAPGIVGVALVGAGVVALGVGLVRKDPATSDHPGTPLDRPDSVAPQAASTASGGQTVQVSNVTSDGNVTISSEQNNG